MITISSTRPRKPPNSLTILFVSISMRRTSISSHTTASRPLSRLSNKDTTAEGRATVCSSFVVWKSKNYRSRMKKCQLYKNLSVLTFTVPSRVLAMTSRFSASLAKPVIHLSPPFFLLELRRLFVTSGGQGPTSKLFRLIPDCMFHMWIPPVEDPAIPKLPQDVTHTA